MRYSISIQRRGGGRGEIKGKQFIQLFIHNCSLKDSYCTSAGKPPLETSQQPEPLHHAKSSGAHARSGIALPENSDDTLLAWILTSLTAWQPDKAPEKQQRCLGRCSGGGRKPFSHRSLWGSDRQGQRHPSSPSLPG